MISESSGGHFFCAVSESAEENVAGKDAKCKGKGEKAESEGSVSDCATKSRLNYIDPSRGNISVIYDLM